MIGVGSDKNHMTKNIEGETFTILKSFLASSLRACPLQTSTLISLFYLSEEYRGSNTNDINYPPPCRIHTFLVMSTCWRFSATDISYYSVLNVLLTITFDWKSGFGGFSQLSRVLPHINWEEQRWTCGWMSDSRPPWWQFFSVLKVWMILGMWSWSRL